MSSFRKCFSVRSCVHALDALDAGHGSPATGAIIAKREKFPARSVNAYNTLPYVFLVDSFCATYNTQKLIKFDIAKPHPSIVNHCTIYECHIFYAA